MKLQIINDIIRFMALGYRVKDIQKLIKESYGVYVQSHGLWKLYHTSGVR